MGLSCTYSYGCFLCASASSGWLPQAAVLQQQCCLQQVLCFSPEASSIRAIRTTAGLLVPISRARSAVTLCRRAHVITGMTNSLSYGCMERDRCGCSVHLSRSGNFGVGSCCTLAAGHFLPHMPFAVAMSQHLHEGSVPGMI